MKKTEMIAIANRAADHLRNGKTPDEIYNTRIVRTQEIARAMKKILANAVVLKLFDINQRVVNGVDNGVFWISTGEIEDLETDFNACLGVIESFGNNWQGNITKEELEIAITYTLYEIENSEEE